MPRDPDPDVLLNEVSFVIGGISLCVSASAADPKVFIDEGHRPFLGSRAEASVRLRARWGDLSRAPADRKKVFDSGGTWVLDRSNGGWVIDFCSALHGATPYKSARLNEDFSDGEIVLHAPFHDAEAAADVLQFPLAELLIINQLARLGGVVLHACGVVDAGRGVLFCGNSGDGKTTTARLWNGRPGVTILSDDRIILRGDQSGFRIYGTPWHGEGEFAANASAPLSAVFLIEHGARNQLIPLSGAEAVSSLLPRCFPPFYDRKGVESVLETLAGLAGSVPCYRFSFVPDDSAAEFIRAAVGRLSR